MENLQTNGCTEVSTINGEDEASADCEQDHKEIAQDVDLNQQNVDTILESPNASPVNSVYEEGDRQPDNELYNLELQKHGTESNLNMEKTVNSDEAERDNIETKPECNNEECALEIGKSCSLTREQMTPNCKENTNDCSIKASVPDFKSSIVIEQLHDPPVVARMPSSQSDEERCSSKPVSSNKTLQKEESKMNGLPSNENIAAVEIHTNLVSCKATAQASVANRIPKSLVDPVEIKHTEHDTDSEKCELVSPITTNSSADTLSNLESNAKDRKAEPNHEHDEVRPIPCSLNLMAETKAQDLNTNSNSDDVPEKRTYAEPIGDASDFTLTKPTTTIASNTENQGKKNKTISVILQRDEGAIILKKEIYAEFENLKEETKKDGNQLMIYLFELLLNANDCMIQVRSDIYDQFEALKIRTKKDNSEMMEHLLDVYKRSITENRRAVEECKVVRIDEKKDLHLLKDMEVAMDKTVRKAMREELAFWFGRQQVDTSPVHKPGFDKGLTHIQAKTVDTNDCSTSKASVPGHTNQANVSSNSKENIDKQAIQRPYLDKAITRIQTKPVGTNDGSLLKPVSNQTNRESVPSPKDIYIQEKKRSRKSVPQKIVGGSYTTVDKNGDYKAMPSAPVLELDDSPDAKRQKIDTEDGKLISTSQNVPQIAAEESSLPEWNYVLEPCDDTADMQKIYQTKDNAEMETSSGLDGSADSSLSTPVLSVSSDGTQTPSEVCKIGEYTVVRENGFLPCPFCDYKSPVAARLKRHITLHTGKEYQCALCDRSYTEEYKLREHIQVKHEKSIFYQCEMCTKGFTSKGGLKYHTKTTHNKDFTHWCKICQKGFNQLQFYQGHMNKHSGVKPYKCNICNKEFSYIATLSAHRRMCPRVGRSQTAIKCEMCGEDFDSVEDLNEHTRTKHFDIVRFQCGCGMEFRWRTSYTNHKLKCPLALTSITPNQTGSEDLATETYDSGMYIVAGNMQATEDSMSEISSSSRDMSVVESSSASIVETNNTVFIDDTTDDSVHPSNELIGQPRVGNLPIVVSEPVEDRTAQSKDYITEKVDNATVYTCVHCGYKTPKLSHLRRHITIHTGKAHKCHLCPKSYTEVSKLREHVKNKHEGMSNYKCTQCSRTFTSKGGITYHMQTVHEKDLKYKCETCGKGFNTLQHFEGHKNTHKGLRPHVCDYCGRGFSYQSVLGAHKKVCSSKKSNNRDPRLANIFPCDECGEIFHQKSYLMEHVQGKHGNTDRYACDCGKVFRWRTSYNTHKTKCSETSKSTFAIIEGFQLETLVDEDDADDDVLRVDVENGDVNFEETIN